MTEPVTAQHAFHKKGKGARDLCRLIAVKGEKVDGGGVCLDVIQKAEEEADTVSCFEEKRIAPFFIKGVDFSFIL